MSEYEKYEEQAAELDAENIFEQFMLRNYDDFFSLLEDYEGDKEELGRFLAETTEEKDIYASELKGGPDKISDDELYQRMSNAFGKETAKKIVYPPEGKNRKEISGTFEAYRLKDEGVIKIHADFGEIEISKPWLLKDGDVKARVKVTPAIGKQIPYDERVKMTHVGTRALAKQVVVMNDLDVGAENVGEEYQDKIRNAILEHKGDARKLARELENDPVGGGDPFKEKSSELPMAARFLMNNIPLDGGTVPIDELSSSSGVTTEKIQRLCKEHDEYFLLVGTEVCLTEEGVSKAEEVSGVVEFASEEEVREKAEEVLEDDPLSYYLESFNKVHISDHLLKIWGLVSALSASCATDTQIHSWALGPSGKGKSSINRKLTKHYLPEDSYAKPTSFSPKALYYLAKEEGPDLFKNKVLFLDEAESYETEEIIPLLRSLTDSDESEISHFTVSDQQAQKLRLEKPIVVWFTSVESFSDEQLNNRFILTNPDDSKETDEAVNEFQKENLHRGKSLNVKPSEAPVITEMIKMIQEETADLIPVTPFNVEWKQSFNRRLYFTFHTLMELIAKIHYKNRHIENGCIVVTKADFELASEIWSQLIGTTVAQVNKDALELLEALPDEQDQQENTSELAMKLDGFTTTHVRQKANQLMETEKLALINAEKKNGRWYYWAGRDKELLVDPEPEIDMSTENAKKFLDGSDVGYSPELEKKSLEEECPVFKTLEELEVTNTHLTVDNSSVEHGQEPDDSSEDSRDLIEIYPEDVSDAKEYDELKEEAKERFGMTEEEFEEAHKHLRVTGDIFDSNPGYWVRI